MLTCSSVNPVPLVPLYLLSSLEVRLLCLLGTLPLQHHRTHRSRPKYCQSSLLLVLHKEVEVSEVFVGIQKGLFVDNRTCGHLPSRP